MAFGPARIRPHNFKQTNGYRTRHSLVTKVCVQDQFLGYLVRFSFNCISSKNVKYISDTVRSEIFWYYTSIWEMCTKLWLENLKGKAHSEDLGVDGRVILEWILGWEGEDCVHLVHPGLMRPACDADNSPPI